MPTVCLNMIVKDEAAVIERCLASVRPFIDRWVIVDTGSTDGTQEIVRRYLNDIPGQLHERPWKNFGHNRTEAIELARGKADYILTMDADNIFCCPPGWRWPDLTADAYQLTLVSGQTRYEQLLLVSDRLRWRWVGVVHEYLDADSPFERTLLRDAWVDRRHEGARSRDPTTFRKDAALLEEALRSDPENSRYMFYLGQSWRDAGEPANARRAYRRRAAMGGWDEEVWYSLFQVALLSARLDASEPEIVDACLKAYQYRPTRAEPLLFLSRWFEGQKRWALSRLYAREAVTIPLPSDGLFLDQTVYQWQCQDALAVAEFWLGRHAEAFALNNFLLLDGDRLPEDQRARVEANRDFSVPSLLPQFVAYPAEGVEKLAKGTPEQHGKSGVTLTITTGGRPDMFETAVNSMLHGFQDVERIDRFICIDNGSGEADRARTRERYPFFEFIFLDGSGVGQARAMNRLMSEVATPWWLHIEGTAHFFVVDRYVSKALAVLEADPGLGQVAFNRNYAVTLAERALVGGLLRRTGSGIRYVEHEYIPEGPDRDAFFKRFPEGSLSNLWRPHFAFTSSLMRTEAMRSVGLFAEEAPDPEMEFGLRYARAGLKTAFFDAVTHIRNAGSA